jgi:hypothetical protein
MISMMGLYVEGHKAKHYQNQQFCYSLQMQLCYKFMSLLMNYCCQTEG